MIIAANIPSDNPALLPAYAHAMRLMDDMLIISGAMGCLVTGLVYSIFTKWGFLRHAWVATKWLITLFMIFSGSFIMGPCVNENAAHAADPVFCEQTFWDNIAVIHRWGTVQLILLAIVALLSVLKPRLRRSSPR